MSLNRCQLTDNLTRELELNHGANGKAVATLQLANNQIWNDGDGHKQGRANFFRVKVFDKAAKTTLNSFTRV